MRKFLFLLFNLSFLFSYAQVQIGSDIDGEAVGDLSGNSVSISADGGRVATGAPANDGGGLNVGHVRIYGGGVLPVELIFFEGTYSNGQALLYWTTASEQDNAGFEIQKSSDGRTWAKIDFVKGKGTSDILNHYTYIDRQPFSDISYYRLKQLDENGDFEYSKVISIKRNATQSSFQIFPNPSKGIFNLEIENPSNQKMQVSIMDNLGRMVWQSSEIKGESSWRKEMVLENNGVYIMSIQIGGEIFFERVVIANGK